MTEFSLAGAIFLAALPLALIAFGWLHYVHAKVKSMAAIDLVSEIKTLVADLKALDFPAFVAQLKSDATGVENAIEGELQILVDDIKGVIADVTAAKASANPVPAVVEPAAEPAPTEAPGA